MQVPQEMDEQFEKMDPDSSLRPTIINVGALLHGIWWGWTRSGFGMIGLLCLTRGCQKLGSGDRSLAVTEETMLKFHLLVFYSQTLKHIAK